jgi:hypothetical protein
MKTASDLRKLPDLRGFGSNSVKIKRCPIYGMLWRTSPSAGGLSGQGVASACLACARTRLAYRDPGRGRARVRRVGEAGRVGSGVVRLRQPRSAPLRRQAG